MSTDGYMMKHGHSRRLEEEDGDELRQHRLCWKAIRDKLQCRLCKKVPVEPCQCLKCQVYLYCTDCIVEVLHVKPFCPQCKQSWLPENVSTNLLLEGVISYLPERYLSKIQRSLSNGGELPSKRKRRPSSRILTYMDEKEELDESFDEDSDAEEVSSPLSSRRARPSASNGRMSNGFTNKKQKTGPANGRTTRNSSQTDSSIAEPVNGVDNEFHHEQNANNEPTTQEQPEPLKEDQENLDDLDEELLSSEEILISFKDAVHSPPINHPTSAQSSSPSSPVASPPSTSPSLAASRLNLTYGDMVEEALRSKKGPQSNASIIAYIAERYLDVVSTRTKTWKNSVNSYLSRNPGNRFIKEAQNSDNMVQKNYLWKLAEDV